MKIFSLFLFVIISSCLPSPRHEQVLQDIPALDTLPVTRLTELQPCDILVKPNYNYLPGTSVVPGGSGYGHAAIVIMGASDTNTLLLLSRSIIFESHAGKVQAEYQVRKIAAFAPGTDYRFTNLKFGPSRFGNLFRLRMDLTEVQKNALIDWLLEHDDDQSSWRAMKYYLPENEKREDNQPEYWYCSLLIWQAFYEVLGIDLDANQGLIVYPNDLINSPFFEEMPGSGGKRIRF